ncbi:hypothetical protein Fmac_028979 [Flemingia macrophylla]|uniref:Uncharacterized protein n=1 Tax=Flemingia macrophylla TaxID=520843 RepID=A0ABD1L916_9FABA
MSTCYERKTLLEDIFRTCQHSCGSMRVLDGDQDLFVSKSNGAFKSATDIWDPSNFVYLFFLRHCVALDLMY